MDKMEGDKSTLNILKDKIKVMVKWQVVIEMIGRKE